MLQAIDLALPQEMVDGVALFKVCATSGEAMQSACICPGEDGGGLHVTSACLSQSCNSPDYQHQQT